MCYDDNDDARCQREIFVKMIAPKVANHVSLKNFFKDAVQLYSSEHKGCTFAHEGKVLHRLSHFRYPDLNIDFRNVLYCLDQHANFQIQFQIDITTFNQGVRNRSPASQKLRSGGAPGIYLLHVGEKHLNDVILA